MQGWHRTILRQTQTLRTHSLESYDVVRSRQDHAEIVEALRKGKFARGSTPSARPPQWQPRRPDIARPAQNAQGLTPGASGALGVSGNKKGDINEHPRNREENMNTISRMGVGRQTVPPPRYFLPVCHRNGGGRRRCQEVQNHFRFAARTGQPVHAADDQGISGCRPAAWPRRDLPWQSGDQRFRRGAGGQAAARGCYCDEAGRHRGIRPISGRP